MAIKLNNLSFPLTFLLTAMLSVSALAAVVVPPTVQPGRIDQQVMPQNTRPAVGGDPVITVGDEKGHAKPLKGEETFTLKAIKFQNQTAFTDEQLLPDYAEFIGKKVSFSTIKQIADKITNHYRNAGYILSRAMVPPQRIEGGIVQIKIIEGYVNKVTIQGITKESRLLNEYADKIRSARPLSAATLERYLLLIQDLPGVTARVTLQPASDVMGASDVVINITQKKIDGSATVDNRGTRYLGPVQGGLTAGFNNMLGVYDRTQLHVTTSADPSELSFFNITHEEQLDSEGTKVIFSAARTQTKPGYRLETADVNGIDTSYGFLVSHPFIRSRQSNLYGNVGFDVRDTDSKVGPSDLYADRLRVLRMGGSYDFVDRFSAVNRFDTELSKGFGWDDNDRPDKRSRLAGRTDFWKGSFNASRLQPIDGPFGIFLATTGQWASDELLTAEQFGLGGANFGSAYDPSEITGDSGIAGRAELQYSRTGDSQWVPAYQLYGFYDIGAVFLRDPAAGQQKIASLASVGLGVRFNVMDPVSGNLELAVPMTRPVAANDPNHGNDARVFFSLAYRY